MEKSLFEILEDSANLCDMQRVIIKSETIKQSKEFLKQNDINDAQARVFLSAWLIYRFPISINEYENPQTKQKIKPYVDNLIIAATSVVIECKHENKLSSDNLVNFQTVFNIWKINDKKHLQEEMQNSVNLLNQFENKVPDEEQKVLQQIKTNINTIANSIKIKLD